MWSNYTEIYVTSPYYTRIVSVTCVALCKKGRRTFRYIQYVSLYGGSYKNI